MPQAARITSALAVAARSLYPDVMGRIGRFEVFVADSSEVGARSSASGRIAVNTGVAALKPTDDWLALVLAREMGHVIAGHHSDNSTASILTSVIMNVVVPGSGLIKSALSFAGSQIAESSGQARQVAEADDIAYRLLAAAGFAPREVALSVALGPDAAQMGESSWARTFLQSTQAFMARVRGRGDNLRFATDPAPPSAREAVVVAPAAPAATVVAGTEGHLRQALPPRLSAEEIVVRARPSGMPGPLLLGGNLVPVRRIE